MRLHHLKHHQTYVDKLNGALEKYPDLAAKPLAELLLNLEKVPEAIRPAVRNNGGGHFNHSLFWSMLKAPADVATHGEPTPREQTITLLDDNFESYEGFKKKFKEAALGQFGSGWAWLVLEANGQAAVVSTPNQDGPVAEGRKILLGLDVWEHAYYLKYQNRRADYVDAFFHIINWDQVEKNLKN